MLVPSSRLVSYLFICQNMNVIRKSNNAWKRQAEENESGWEVKQERICTHVNTEYNSFQILKALHL